MKRNSMLESNLWEKQSHQSFQNLNETQARHQQAGSVTTRIIILVGVIAILVSIFLGLNYLNKESPKVTKEVSGFQEGLERMIHFYEKRINKEQNEEEELYDETKSNSWNWSIFGSTDCQKYRQQLDLLIPTVNTKLEEFPNLQHLKNDQEYLQEIKKQLHGIVIPENDKDNFLICANKYIEWKQYYEPKTEEENNELLEYLKQDRLKYGNPSRVLDELYIHELQKKAKDLVRSQQNFTFKKARLDKFREEYMNVKNDLRKCASELDEKQNLKSSLENENAQKQQELNDLNRQLEDQNKLFNEKKGNLDQKQQDYVEKKGDLNNKLNDLNNDINNAEQIRKNIKNRKDSNDLKRKQILNNERTNEKLVQENKVKQNKVDQLSEELRILDKDIHNLNHMIKIYQLKLSVSSSDSGIKDIMETMFDKNFSKERLKQQMEEKISEEKKILDELQEYQRDKELMPKGDIVIEKEDFGIEKEIEQMIHQQKKKLVEFMNKYQDLEKFIEEYKEQSIQVEQSKKVLIGYQQDLVNDRNNKGQIERSIQELTRELNQNNDQIKNRNDENERLNQLIIDNENYIKEKELSLSQNQILYEEIKKKLSDFEKENREIEEQINGVISAVENEKRRLSGLIYLINNNMADIKQKLQEIEFEFVNQSKTCTQLLAFYKKSNEKVEFLQNDYLQTTRDLANLRKEYQEHHDISSLQFY